MCVCIDVRKKNPCRADEKYEGSERVSKWREIKPVSVKSIQPLRLTQSIARVAYLVGYLLGRKPRLQTAGRRMTL